MTASSSRKKHLGRLFDANPPRRSELVGALFCNRVRELQHAIGVLRSSDYDKIAVVHGATRGGKSHLVLRLLGDPAIQEQFSIFRMNANNRGTAWAVLDEFFYDLFRHLRDDLDEAAAGEAGILEEFREVMRELQQVEPFVGRRFSGGDVAEKVGSKGTGSLGVKSTLVASVGDEVTNEEVRKSIRTAFDERRVAEEVRKQCQLVRAMTSRQVLLYVDDLDLLEPDGVRSREGQLLVSALKLLAEDPAILVLASIRTTNFDAGRDKDFVGLVEVGVLNAPGLREVHDRHIEVLHAGERIFEPEVVDWMAAGSGGRVGLFLQRCRDVWERSSPDLPVTLEVAKRFVVEEIDKWRLAGRHIDFLATLERAVESGELEVRLDAPPEPSVRFRVVSPVRARVGWYRVDPLYAEALLMSADEG